MGAGPARCCNVSTAEKRRGAGAGAASPAMRGTSVTQLSGIKGMREFKILYKEKGPVQKGGSVSSVVSTDNNLQYVCRKIKMSDVPVQNEPAVNRHCQLLSGLEHPHLCKFVEAFQDKTSVCMIYEKANPTTLFDHIRERSSLTEEEAADYLRQVVMALSVAHAHGVAHGRLSPRSIILSYDADDDEDFDTQLKVCDMGQAFVLRPMVMQAEETPKGLETEKYAASPELVLKDFAGSADGTMPKGADKSDIWALGVVFYHMLSGVPPFKISKRQDIVDKVAATPIAFQGEMWGKLSASARDIVESMLKINPGLRLSAAQLLKHPWVRVAKATFPRKQMVQLLSNLRINVQECEFKRFVLRVVSELLPRDGKTVDTVESAFRCLDRNGDGVLTVEEVVKGIKKHLNIGSGNQELEQLFRQIDRDNSGTVNVAEFLSASMDQKRSTSLPVLWEAFNAFDRDRSGCISFEEIDKIVQDIEGALLSKDQVDKLCTEIRRELEGVSKNGQLDFDHFVYIMNNSEPNGMESFKKDFNRIFWDKCGVDCYKVRQNETKSWDISKLTSPKSPHSVYRKRGSRRRGEPDTAG